MNLALLRSGPPLPAIGAPKDVVASSTPTCSSWPGSVGRRCIDYVDARTSPTAARSSPRASSTTARSVLFLPRNPLPTLATTWITFFAHQASPQACVPRVQPPAPEGRAALVAQRRGRSRARHALGLLPVPAARGRAIGRSAALMDERYPLYYEDTDLFAPADARAATASCFHGGATDPAPLVAFLRADRRRRSDDVAAAQLRRSAAVTATSRSSTASPGERLRSTRLTQFLLQGWPSD